MARAKSAAQTPAAKSDAYVGLLAISLMAQITGAVFFYLDWSAYPTAQPKPPTPISIPAGGGGAPAPAPAPAPPM
ncbi:MAG: hypothetical protein ACRC33_26530 [Gemmataceae bacterium]